MMYTHPVRLYDTPVLSLPDDLYIPPEAFAIWLEQFEGPLDFLLYLVKKNNFDIRNMPILPIIEQYLVYIQELKSSHFELAGDYLLMASTLIAIKSAVLLPHTPNSEDKETNPTKKLIQKLEEYAQIKAVSKKLDDLVRLERDVFLAYASLPEYENKPTPTYCANALIHSLLKIQPKSDHTFHLQTDNIPLADKIIEISQKLAEKKHSSFFELIQPKQGKIGIVVSFMAVLELSKQNLIRFASNFPKQNPESNPITQITLVWIG